MKTRQVWMLAAGLALLGSASAAPAGSDALSGVQLAQADDAQPDARRGMAPRMGPGMGAPGQGPMMGRGGMGQGQGMGPGGAGAGPWAMLDLSPEQQQKVRQIQRELRRQQWEAQGQLMEAREDLQDLMMADERDAAAIGKAYERIAQLQRPMLEARVKAADQIEGVLDEQQRDALRQMRRDGMGMMGSGMMGPGMMGQGGMGMMNPGMMGGGMGYGPGMMDGYMTDLPGE